MSANYDDAPSTLGNFNYDALDHLEQAQALAIMLTGEGYEAFAGWNGQIQQRVLWLLYNEISRARQAYRAEEVAREERARLATIVPDPDLREALREAGMRPDAPSWLHKAAIAADEEDARAAQRREQDRAVRIKSYVREATKQDDKP